ncbi:MAG TPA: lamin tail domain-containing protein, partial [Gemmatimonadaceae bacterium]
MSPLSPRSAQHSLSVSTPSVVISQIYGGGGNSGATLKNDFIELFNPGSQPVSVTGWSVQYASSVGTTWQVTNLSGTIPAGGYYLVQEAQGAGGTTPLPTPDASGTIAMSATAGKVSLVSTTTALTGACPVGFVDQVSFGTAASDCGFKTTATLSNTTAAVRGNQGCAFTGDLSVDFAAAAPTPRNSAIPIHLCPGALPVGPLDHVLIAGPT